MLLMDGDNIPASIFLQEGIFLEELELFEAVRYASRMDKDVTARNIRALRTHLGSKQADFAKTLKTQQANVSKWENGETKPEGINLARLVHLASTGPDEFTSQPWAPPAADNEEAPRPWAPQEDTIKWVLDSGLFSLSASSVPPEDFQLLVRGVTKGLQLVAAQPTMEDDPGFRKAVETAIAHAIDDYRHSHGRSA